MEWSGWGSKPSINIRMNLINPIIKHINISSTSKLLMIVVVCSNAFESIARGGGGGGSSSGGRGINPLTIIFLIISIVFSIMAYFRHKAALKVIKAAKENMWDLSNLQLTAETAFFKFQDAWTERDLSKMSSLITYSFYNRYRLQLDEMKAKGEKNMIESISIASTNIICCRDYKNNQADTFSALIKGSLIDYTIKENTDRLIKGSKSQKEKFTDYYVFTRDGNSWLLNEVINDPELGIILEAKSYSEEN
jgi:hypothetical protein